MTNIKIIYKKQLLSLLMAAAILTVSACAEKKRDSTVVTVKEFVAADTKNFNHHLVVNKLSVSGDGKNIYLTANTNKNLFYHDSSDDLNSNWTEIKLATGLDGSVGKAKLETANAVEGISASKDGALVRVSAPTPAVGYAANTSPDHGVFHVVGKDHKAAWASSLQDVEAVASGNPIADPGIADKIGANLAFVKEIVVNNGGVDVPYLFGFDVNKTFAAGAARFIAMTKADLSPAKIGLLVKRDPSALDEAPEMINGGEYLFMATSLGINTIAKTDIAKAKNFDDLLATEVGDVRGRVVSDKFKMAGAKATDVNKSISSLMVSGSNLFIGLKTAVGIDLSGGVAVYEIKAPGTAPVVHAPDLSWKGLGVSSLIKDDAGTVWAISGKNIFKAEISGAKGERYIDSLASDGGYKKDSFPNEDIDSAAFVNGELVMATPNGLYYVKKTEKTLAGSKLVDGN